MTKIEMINRMIILGCINEEDRNRWMKHSKEYITNIYIEIVPIRLAYLNKQNLHSRPVDVVKTSTAVLSIQERLAASVRIFVRITYENKVALNI